MDIFIRILVSATLIYAINFVMRTFTTNNFDKMFMPKYQKTLHNMFMYVSIFIVFIIYGIFFAALYRKVHDTNISDVLVSIMSIAYFIFLLITGVTCIYKFVCDKTKKKQFMLSEKYTNMLVFIVFLLNILIYSIISYEMYDAESKMDKMYVLGNLLSCTVLFFLLAYLLLKSSLYLQGINKREWDYVLSPTPENIDQKHLYVLYSLTPTTLVLSDDLDNRSYPKSVYLYDLNKQSYSYFNRVVNLRYKKASF